MVTEQEQKNIIANNIISRRKDLKLTQAELAEKLNYSDKAISKWERAEAIPDVYILRQLAVLFDVTVDDMINPYAPKKTNAIKSRFLKKRVIIPLLSSVLAWVVAIIIYSLLVFLTAIPEYKTYLVFIYALPIMSIILLVFSIMWWKRFVQFSILTVLLWTVALSLFLTLNIAHRFLFFMIPIPIQVLFLLWYIMKIGKK